MTHRDYYEIHVTLNTDDGEPEPRWNYSKIDGDPDLGTGTRHYRTTHAGDIIDALESGYHCVGCYEAFSAPYQTSMTQWDERAKRPHGQGAYRHDGCPDPHWTDPVTVRDVK